MLRFILRFGLPIIAIGWLLYVPVYDGYGSFSTLSLALTFMNMIFNYLPRVAVFLGLGKNHEVRRGLLNFAPSLSPITRQSIQTEDVLFNEVKVRVYWPENFDKLSEKKLPGIIYYHGGGCVIGSVNAYDSVVREIVHDLSVVAVSVEYRLAPEHIFPAALDDCLAATEYLFNNAKAFGVDASRIGLMGDSAGGYLAAAVSQKLNKKKLSHPAVKLQILLYPVLQMIDLHTPSYQQNAKDVILSRELMIYYFSLYAFGSEDLISTIVRNNHTSAAVKQQMAKGLLDHSLLPDRFRAHNYIKPDTNFGNERIWAKVKDVLLNPDFAPLLATDLKNLPPTILLTCEHDVLRDDGLFYAKRLEQAKVPVTRIHADLGFHGIINLFDMLPEAYDVYSKVIAQIKAQI